MAQTDRQTNRQTDGHGDSMTESAQWADSVKNLKNQDYLKKQSHSKKSNSIIILLEKILKRSTKNA